jgi:hypothetical protein
MKNFKNLPAQQKHSGKLNLAGSLKFRNPYQDDHKQSVLNFNLFQSASSKCLKRRKSISSGNAHALGKSPQAKRARVDLVDVGEDDEFSSFRASFFREQSSTQEQSSNAENENVFVNEAKVMLRILRNPGDSIGKLQNSSWINLLRLQSKRFCVMKLQDGKASFD